MKYDAIKGFLSCRLKLVKTVGAYRYTSEVTVYFLFIFVTILYLTHSQRMRKILSLEKMRKKIKILFL